MQEQGHFRRRERETCLIWKGWLIYYWLVNGYSVNNMYTFDLFHLLKGLAAWAILCSRSAWNIALRWECYSWAWRSHMFFFRLSNDCPMIPYCSIIVPKCFCVLHITLWICWYILLIFEYIKNYKDMLHVWHCHSRISILVARARANGCPAWPMEPKLCALLSGLGGMRRIIQYESYIYIYILYTYCILYIL